MKSKHGFETTQERSDFMRKIKAKNTTPEIILRKALWKEGIRYRLENKKITGNPDIAIKKHKIKKELKKCVDKVKTDVAAQSSTLASR